MEVTLNPTLPVNAGIDYTDCLPGKPTKDANGKWNDIILPPDAVREGVLVSARVALVTSTGAATPATVTEFVRQTTNGNYVFSVKRDTLPDAVKQIRKQVADAAKADYKANGPVRRQTAPVSVVVPGATVPTTVPTMSNVPTAVEVKAPNAPAAGDKVAAMVAKLSAMDEFDRADILATLSTEGRAQVIAALKANVTTTVAAPVAATVSPAVLNTPANVPSIPAIPTARKTKAK